MYMSIGTVPNHKTVFLSILVERNLGEPEQTRTLPVKTSHENEFSRLNK